MKTSVLWMKISVLWMKTSVLWMKNTDLWMKICSAGPARSRPGGPGGAGAGPERRNLSRGVRRSESARNVGRSDVP